MSEVLLTTRCFACTKAVLAFSNEFATEVEDLAESIITPKNPLGIDVKALFKAKVKRFRAQLDLDKGEMAKCVRKARLQQKNPRQWEVLKVKKRMKVRMPKEER